MQYISTLMQDAASFSSQLKDAAFDCMENEDFEILWRQSADGCLYVIKWQSGLSVMESLETAGACDGSETLRSSLREFYVNQKLAAQELKNRTGNCYYSELLDCLDDKNFIGIVMCNLAVSVKAAGRIGPLSLVRLFSYRVLFLRIDGVDFSGEKPDTSEALLYGFMTSGTGEKKCFTDAAASFSLQLEQVGAGMEKQGFKNPFLKAELALYHMYGRAAEARSSLELYGVYNRVESGVGSNDTYRFAVCHSEELYFAEGSLEALTIEQAVVGYEENNDRHCMDLNCTGRLFFRRISDGFDAFGYGYREVGTDEADYVSSTLHEGYIKYQGLHLELTLAEDQSSIAVFYRDIRLTEQREFLLSDAVYAQLPHEPLEFLCHETGTTPEALGFHQIDTPVHQEKLWSNAVWYGLLMPITLFHAVTIQVLFVFSDKTCFSAYGKMKFGKNSTGINVSSLMKLEAKDIMLYQEKGQTVRLMLKGLKLSLFGLKLPEGSVNAALLPDADGQMCWYCVSEK